MMTVIFAFSAQDHKQTHATSDIVVKPVESAIQSASKKTFDTEDAEKKYFKDIHTKVNLFIRKSAHFINFSLLGIFMFLLFSSLGRDDLDATMATLFLCTLYAASDELHQRLVSARNGNFRDVCIDVFGTVCMVFFIYIIKRIRRKKV